MSKKIIFLLVLFISVASFGQKAKGLYMKKQKATLYFRDGTTLEGLAKITSFNDIKFIKNKKSKKITYNSKLVYKLIIHNKNVDIEFHYKIVFERPNPILLEVAVNGRLSLYRELQVSYYNASTPILYVAKNNSDFAYIIGHTSSGSTSNRSKKEILNYVEDCPSLVKLIQNKKYKSKNIEWIVKYYNEHCGKENIASQKEESTNTEIKN